MCRVQLAEGEGVIPLIKALREMTTLGLKEAKDIVEGILYSVEIIDEKTCDLGHTHVTASRFFPFKGGNQFIYTMDRQRK